MSEHAAEKNAPPKRCLHTWDDGTQCHWLDWCPIHGSVDECRAPVVLRGILTTADLADGGSDA